MDMAERMYTDQQDEEHSGSRGRCDLLYIWRVPGPLRKPKTGRHGATVADADKLAFCLRKCEPAKSLTNHPQSHAVQNLWTVSHRLIRLEPSAVVTEMFSAQKCFFFPTLTFTNAFVIASVMHNCKHVTASIEPCIWLHLIADGLKAGTLPWCARDVTWVWSKGFKIKRSDGNKTQNYWPAIDAVKCRYANIVLP